MKEEKKHHFWTQESSIVFQVSCENFFQKCKVVAPVDQIWLSVTTSSPADNAIKYATVQKGLSSNFPSLYYILAEI